MGLAPALSKALAALLDTLLTPLLLCASLWVHRRQAEILRDGVPLTAVQRELAAVLGIVAVDRIRVVNAAVVPMPLPGWLRAYAQRAGWISRHIAGMTLGHGIVIREEYAADLRLLAHELAHVGQYERLGGIVRFMRQYLRECAWPGYPHGALEREAQAAEACGSAVAADVLPYRHAAAAPAPPRIS